MGAGPEHFFSRHLCSWFDLKMDPTSVDQCNANPVWNRAKLVAGEWTCLIENMPE